MTARTRPALLGAAPALAILALLVVTAAAGAQVTAEIGIDQNRQLGTHRTSGALLIYTPDPLQPGSSVSHWDTSATPNLLMEPAINPDLPFLGLDITPGLMSDIGWPLTGEPNAPGPVTFNIFPLDPPGTGFTDPRPFAGAPGNPATTLGEARVNLMEAVLDAWGTALASDVPVDVLVTWQPLPCTAGVGAVLAAAGPLSIFADDQGALPVNNTWYPGPLAEALVGEDLTGPPSEPNGGDVIVLINSDLDNECLGPGTGYYYGLDGNDPSNQIDLAPVVLHELGHGLGFTTFTDDGTGEEFRGMPSIYDTFLRDEEAHMLWPEMTDGQRQQSAINFRDLTWIGPDANALAAPYLDYGVPELRVTAPASVAGAYEIGPASFGGDIPAGGLPGDVACMVDAQELPDGGLGTILDGCSAALNPGALAGRIALIDRGGCAFVDKARHAQEAGAIGAIIVNNAGKTPPGLGGTDPEVTIPVISLGADDGNRIRQAACPSQSAYLHDRFQVTLRWNRQRPGLPADMGDGHGVQITNNAAWFYFARPDNPQLLVKIINGCGLDNQAWWVFAGGVTNQEVFLTVTDTGSGVSKTYHNPAGVPYQTILDTDAFATCP